MDEGKLFLREMLQLINEERMVELEYYHFATSNELMDLGIEEQWLLTSPKGKAKA